MNPIEDVSQFNIQIIDGDIAVSNPNTLTHRNAVSSSERNCSYWVDGKILYRLNFDNVSEDGIDSSKISKAIEVYEQDTCLEFIDISNNKSRWNESHLVFFFSGRGCWSYVGRQCDLNGQLLSLAPGCLSIWQTAAHEIGHAVGLYHHQSRPDRDDFVKIAWGNIKPSMEHNFKKRCDSMTYDVKYDYLSLMHYGKNYFSRNGFPTLIPKDPLYIDLIGRGATTLSFGDKKTLNRMYRCYERCNENIDCLNGGFLNHRCKCECPDGFCGSQCQHQVPTDLHCGGRITEHKVITTRNFPGKHSGILTCSWHFPPQNCKRLNLNFTEIKLTSNERRDHIKIYEGDMLKEKYFIGSNATKTEAYNFKSNLNHVRITFVSRRYEETDTGFSCNVSFTDDEACNEINIPS